MRDFKEKLSENLMSLIYIVIGIIMLLNPKFVSDAINYLIGGFIILVGVFFVIRILQNKEFKDFSKLELLIALLCVGFGLFLMFNSSLLISILPIGAGLLIFLDAISQIMKSFKLRKVGVRLWFINLFIGLIFFAFAIYLIVNAMNISYLVIRLIGVVLIIDAIFEFYTSFKIKEYDNNVKVIETEIVSVKKDI